MTGTPPHNLEAEAAVLGAVFLANNALPRLVDEGLQPRHFYRLQHASVYQAMLNLFDRGDRLDTITVCNELVRHRSRVTEADVHMLAGAVPIAAAFPQYARQVIELAQLRDMRVAAVTILEGVDRRDPDKIAEGERLLTHRQHGRKCTSTPEDLAHDAYRRLEAGEPETFQWPVPRLNKLTAGGMRRGQLTVIAGHTSFGKSIVLDQCLESATHAGLATALYLNEMTKAERTDRALARLARVSLERIMLNRLDPAERTRVTNALPKLPFAIVDAAGWTAQDIRRDVIRNHYDLVGIDIFNRMPHRKLEEKDESSRLLNELAKEQHGNCHVLLCAHLNRNRTGQTAVRPAPTLSDLRDTGMLERDADNVLFVHRDQDPETGNPLPTGSLWFAKVRNGRLGGVPAKFQGEFMRFDPTGPAAFEQQDKAA